MGAPQIGSIVVVGGLDPGGGAGLLRDVLTARTRGALPIAIGTAWTTQDAGTHRVEAREAEALRAAVAQAVAGRPGAVKIGMVPDAPRAAALLAGLADYRGPIVLDPVLRSSRGGLLYRGEPGGLAPLLRRATIVTPNATEAEALTGRIVADLAGAEVAGLALRDAGAAAVLIKGGHLGGSDEPATDTLVWTGGTRRFPHARVPGGDVRGTGCALATALAVELGRGADLETAVGTATAWLVEALGHAVSVDGERHLP